MEQFKTLCLVSAAALLLASGPAPAQVYSWKDPHTGQSRLSSMPPPWYSRGELVGGPRVIKTLGERVVDDTALPYEDRLLLSGKSKDSVQELRLQQTPVARTPPEPVRESAKPDAEAAIVQAPDTRAARADPGRKKGS